MIFGTKECCLLRGGGAIGLPPTLYSVHASGGVISGFRVQDYAFEEKCQCDEWYLYYMVGYVAHACMEIGLFDL